ncbi:MAG TPA: hypothetical protein VFB82_16290 [Blastocatellia bacterium]|nr:hypothetical protein [Blastocatellia bacterium]
MNCIACNGVRGVQSYDFIGYKKILHGTGYTVETHRFSGEACLDCIEKLRESRLRTFQRVLRIMPPLVFAAATVGLAFAIGPASEFSVWGTAVLLALILTLMCSGVTLLARRSFTQTRALGGTVATRALEKDLLAQGFSGFEVNSSFRKEN